VLLGWTESLVVVAVLQLVSALTIAFVQIQSCACVSCFCYCTTQKYTSKR